MSLEILNKKPKILTWEYLLHFDNNPPTFPFPRDLNVQNQYEIFKNKLLIQKKTISNNIISLYFNDDDIEYRICDNDFPYKTVPGIKHILIWFNPKNKLNELLPNTFNDGNHKRYVQYLLNDFDEYKDKEFIMWENLPTNKSVHDIRHIHIFIKM